MDEKVRAEFKREFNTAVGDLLASLRKGSGLNLNQVAEALAKSRLERVKRLEAGEESLHGSDLIELIQLYGGDFADASMSIQRIAENARAKYPIACRPAPGVSNRPEGHHPQNSPPTSAEEFSEKKRNQ